MLSCIPACPLCAHREGEANAGILEYLAGVLQLRKRDVTLAVGSKSREKVVHVQGITPEEALTRLRAASDADVLVQSVLPSR